MSAAVSHELNQPLAAMKTYLAGARLLLDRRRFAEAGSSFQRIDDLIERMGAITRQLKSYARKGGDAFEPVDLRDALKGALTIMEPQCVHAGGDHAKPAAPPGDGSGRPAAAGTGDHQPAAKRARRDEGQRQARDRPPDRRGRRGGSVGARQRPGIEDLETLFEPFYTTKKPGEGVGLGLAISSGIVSDLGGRLTARNPDTGGAVFEIRLPLLADAADLSGEGFPVGGQAEWSNDDERDAAMKIAIVDDEQDMRQSISQWLALSGFETETFPSAEDALKVHRPGFSRHRGHRCQDARHGRRCSFSRS
jgi:two-component system C4-dicarboxylate transport sensor histidine kinase DctB